MQSIVHFRFKFSLENQHYYCHLLVATFEFNFAFASIKHQQVVRPFWSMTRNGVPLILIRIFDNRGDAVTWAKRHSTHVNLESFPIPRVVFLKNTLVPTIERDPEPRKLCSCSRANVLHIHPYDRLLKVQAS